MTQPPDSDVRRLTEVADELREVFSERGHRVEVALDVDPAFGSGNSRSWLRRDLALDTIVAAASRAGLEHKAERGAHEIRILSRNVDRRYRLLKASRSSGGEFVITVNSDSSLVVEDDSLFRSELWVYSWTFDADGTVEDVFIAEVRGHVDGHPCRLVLGPVTLLGSSGPSRGGFEPGDEGLPGFDDGEESGDGDAYGSA
jgi:hypothetical protein